MNDLLHEDKKEVNRGCDTSELADIISDFFQTKMLRTRNTIVLMLTAAGSLMFGQHCVHTGPILDRFAKFRRMSTISSALTNACEVVTA